MSPVAMAEATGQPQQAIILAAGRGSKLRPYTDTLPTALLPVAEKPMVAHTIDALRRQGVSKFVVCRGWQGRAFEESRAALGEGVELVDCPDYASTGMLESLRIALQSLDTESGFYVAYGDIMFRPSIARQLREAASPVSVVVNAAAPGNQSKAPGDVESVVAVGNGAARRVRMVGKNRRGSRDDIVGEFAGLVKVSAEARSAVDKSLAHLWRLHEPSTGDAAAYLLPWWLEPVHQASICDFLQYFVDEGGSVGLTTIFGGWHEVNTPADFTRAQNDTSTFLSEQDARAQVAAMGACLLSEANDLKRPLPLVAKELGVDFAMLENLLQGDLDVTTALDVLKRMSEVYPVPLNDLWLDADDTTGGVRIFSAAAAEASSRVLDRPDRTGARTPYYEYRDAAMSRCSQFRPEWIKELRVVRSGDPFDPDVVLNNGHLMMQTTLFVGPVDFYYKDSKGTVHREEMNTGDSNFISPFVPHSFTVREEGVEGIIIAVTYGGNVRRAFTEFSRVGASRVFSLAGDKRDPALARRCMLQRHLQSECLSEEGLAAAVAGQVAASRVEELLAGADPTFAELQALADALSVRVSDLHVSALEDREEVVVTRSADSLVESRDMPGYRLTPLARTRHQPDLKTFDLEVLPSATPGPGLQCGLHTFAYHFGSEAVELSWDDRGRVRRAVLHPGDSAYLAPLVEHRFSVCAGPASERRPPGCGTNPNGRCCGEGRRVFLVRIPGHLTGETLAEFATFSASGRDRVGAETMQWYA